MISVDEYVRMLRSAQDEHWPTPAIELLNGRKETHWSWFFFPNVVGLGASETAVKYAVPSVDHARALLRDPVMRERANVLISTLRLLYQREADFNEVLGQVDFKKFASYATMVNMMKVPGMLDIGFYRLECYTTREFLRVPKSR